MNNQLLKHRIKWGSVIAICLAFSTIFPTKSIQNLFLETAQAEIGGFSLDRRWMLVDRNGGFLSQRTHHQMALLQVLIVGDRLRVFHKQNPEWTHDIPLEPETKEFIPVTVWSDTMAGQLVNPSSDKWFSKMLNFPCQLVYMPDSTKRPVNERYAVNNEIVSFADAMPYLLIGQRSLDNLNKKLGQPLPMNRFRPNLVFSGGDAFQEDT